MFNRRFRTVVFVLAVSLVSAACDSSDLTEKDVSQLEDTQWNLIQIGKHLVSDEYPDLEPNLMFHSDDHSLSGSGGCNQLGGSYAVDGERITFGPINSTLRGCAEGMGLEQVFFESLNFVESWQVNQGLLDLFNLRGQPLMRFESVGS